VDTWTDFIHDAPPCGHAVQIYMDTAELAATAASFLGLGLASDEPAVAILTSAHRDLLVTRLGMEGLDSDALIRDGLLTIADAEEVLPTLMEDGFPSPERFEDRVGGLIDGIAARHPGKRIRAFGEMVDVLVKRGDTDAAIALEELWNALSRTRDFALLCAYEIDLFDHGVQAGALPAICRTHSHVRTVADPLRLSRAVDRALSEILGPNETAHVYMNVAEHMPRTNVPRSQALLMWLSAHEPAKANRVLTRARSHYLGALAPAS
jgi:hypothetical protein